MAKRRVLVVGAGIAGTSLSTFLAKAGDDVTVIERSPSFQARGHILAVKGVGVEILKSLGALDQAKAHELPARSLDIFTGAGRFLRHVENKELDDTLGGYLLLRRAHLQQALYDRRDPSVTFRFGMQAEQLARSASGDALLKPCIFRSRRRMLRCEFSARLFSRNRPGLCRSLRPSRSRAALYERKPSVTMTSGWTCWLFNSPQLADTLAEAASLRWSCLALSGRFAA